MARQWTTVEEGIVEVDPRHLKMQSAQAIRSVLDALVELITNCDDAYRSIGDDKKRRTDRKALSYGSGPSETETRARAAARNEGTRVFPKTALYSSYGDVSPYFDDR